MSIDSASPREVKVIRMREIPDLGQSQSPVPRPPSDRPVIPPKPNPSAWGAVITVPLKRHQPPRQSPRRSVNVIHQMEPTPSLKLPFQVPLNVNVSQNRPREVSTDFSDVSTTPRCRTEQFRFSMDSSLSGFDSPKFKNYTEEKPRKESEKGIVNAQLEMDYSNLHLSGSQQNGFTDSFSSGFNGVKLLDREELEKNAVAVSSEDFQIDVDASTSLALPSLESVLGKERYERLMRNIEDIEECEGDSDVQNGDIASQIWKDSARDSEVSTQVGRPICTSSDEALSDELCLETHRPGEEAIDPIYNNTTPEQRYIPEEQGLDRNYHQDRVKVAFSADQIYARASNIFHGDRPDLSGNGDITVQHEIRDSMNSEFDTYTKQLDQVSLVDDQSDVSFDMSGVQREYTHSGPPAEKKKAKPKPNQSKPLYELPPLTDRQLEHMERIRFSVENRY